MRNAIRKLQSPDRGVPSVRRTKVSTWVAMISAGVSGFVLGLLAGSVIISTSTRTVPSVVMVTGYPIHTSTPILTPTTEATLTPTVTPTPEPKPEWLTAGCIVWVQQVVGGELNGTSNYDSMRFVATQVMYDIAKEGVCQPDLIKEVWFAKWPNVDQIPTNVSAAVNSVITDWPMTRWRECLYTWSMSDLVDYKRSHPRVKLSIDYAFTDRGTATAVYGINCTQGG